MDKVKVKLVKPNWFWRAYLWLNAKVCRTNRIIGFTTFWHTVILVPDHWHDRRLLAHELTHVTQIDNRGIWGFTKEYVAEFFRVGYHNNKFEKEARRVAATPVLREKMILKYNLEYVGGR